MNAKTVKLALLRELVEAGSVRSAAIIGLPGGYAVQVRYGMSDRALHRRGACLCQNRCRRENIAWLRRG